MKAEIIFTKDRLPESVPSDGFTPAEYLWVMTRKYGNMKAMFINNTWMTSYASKLMDKVVWWVEITK